MSWKTKPSSTMQIPRRAEPYVTAAVAERWEREIVSKYHVRKGALMPILHELQHEHRCIPYQAMVEVARFLGISPAEVLDCATFYEEFSLEPRGRCTIGICQSIACEACDHKPLLDHCRRTLGIEPGETTPDGAFTLLAMECLGSCDTAPVALFNETLHEKLDVPTVDRLIAQARQAPAAGHHH
jgi:NADH:ubiquinone oxidoreductase subunit E